MDPAKAAYDAYRKFWQGQPNESERDNAALLSWDELRPMQRDAWRVATIASDLHRAQVECSTLPEAIERISKQPGKCTVCDGAGVFYTDNRRDGFDCNSCRGTGKT